MKKAKVKKSKYQELCDWHEKHMRLASAKITSQILKLYTKKVKKN